MTTLETMYAPQVNSPATTLSANISSSATSISVLNGSVLPAAPNLLVIGGDTDSAETVRMTAKSGNTLTVVRGVQGTAKSWSTGALIARLFTAKDLSDVQTNITALNSGKAEQTDLAAAEDRIDDVYASSASGSTASYYRTVGGLPVDDLTIDINPVQAGTGDPAPDNVRAISGWTGANVFKAGKNLLDQSKYLTSTTSTQGLSLTWNSDGSISFANTSTNTSAKVTQLSNPFYLPAGTYYFSGAGTSANIYLRLRSYTNGTPSTNIRSGDGEFTLTEGSYVDLAVYIKAQSASGMTYSPMICTVSDASYEPYSGSTTAISWQTEAGTVYGGTLDVTTGVLTVTDANIASYAGETLPSTWISSKDVYAAGTTPTTGAQVVYKLATPTTYQLTPVQVTSLLGENNVWADTGNTTATFGADIKSYIDNTTGGKQDKIFASGILKGNGSGGVSAAVAGTDYQAPLTAGTDYQTPLAEEKLQYYGVCSTAASTQAKTVTIDGITALTTGLEIRVKMTNAQTYNGTPKLNVNSLGAKDIMQHGSTAAVRYQWQAGEVVSLTYDGTYWVLENNSLATTTYFGLTRLSSATNSTAEDSAATPKAVKTAYDLANAAVPATEKGTSVATLAVVGDSTTPTVPRLTPAQGFAPIFEIDSDTTLAAKHAGGILVCTNSPTITIPVSVFDAATEIEILNYGTGIVTVAGASGVSLNGASAGSKQIKDQYTSGVLLAISASQWVIQGAIE